MAKPESERLTAHAKAQNLKIKEKITKNKKEF